MTAEGLIRISTVVADRAELLSIGRELTFHDLDTDVDIEFREWSPDDAVRISQLLFKNCKLTLLIEEVPS